MSFLRAAYIRCDFMKTNKEIRELARQKLRGHPGRLAAAALAAALLNGLNVLMLLVEVPVLLYTDNDGHMRTFIFAGALTLHIILGVTVGGMVEIGHDRLYLRMLAGQDVRVAGIFELKRAWWPAAQLRLLIAGEIMLRLLLLIVPGLIGLFRYALAPFLMAQDPAVAVPEAVRVSGILMKGYTWKLARLLLGLFPWFMLSVATAGIGFVFLIPRVKACLAEFYTERVAEHDASVRYASTHGKAVIR